MATEKKKPSKDAFLMEDIMAIRERDAKRIRQELEMESEADRQLRLYREGNARKFG